jgi:hypothetical protein
MNEVTIAKLHSLFDCENGVLYRKTSPSLNALAGSIAGYRKHNGYWVVTINQRKFLRSRIVFAMHNGRWPSEYVDHINGDTSDDKHENLRDVPARKNQQNQQTHRDGHMVGTTFHRATGKWQSQIMINGLSKYLGVYATQEEAHSAYVAALNSGTKP